MTQEANKQDNGRETTAVLPPVDVIEDATGITLYADMPGVAREQVKLHVEADTLTIEGEVTLATPAGLAASHAEVQVPRYRRAFTLSKELDPERIAAEMAHGVLTLRIPKAQHAQPRKVQIRVE